MQNLFPAGVDYRQRIRLSYRPGRDATTYQHGGMCVLADDAAELLRLRNSYHQLEKQLWGNTAVGKELARGLGELRDQVRKLEERVDGMSKAEEIASAVTAALRADRSRRFTLPRRLAGAAAAAVLLIPALHDLAVWVAG